MRRLLLMTFVLMVGATVALAADLPGGRIGIFSDNGGTNCAVTDNATALLPIYVVHTITTGATACQYKATKPSCLTASLVGESSPFGVVDGNSQIGVSVGDGSCRVGTILVQTLSYFASGTTPTCCLYEITCAPLSETQACALGYVDIVNCSEQLAYAKPQIGVINPDATCLCVDIVPAQESSWGKIKALYSE